MNAIIRQLDTRKRAKPVKKAEKVRISAFSIMDRSSRLMRAMIRDCDVDRTIADLLNSKPS